MQVCDESHTKIHLTLEMGTPDRANLTQEMFPVSHCVSMCTFA